MRASAQSFRRRDRRTEPQPQIQPDLTGEDMAKSEQKITRKVLIDGLNEDLSREYQAIIAYVNYSQVLKGAQYMNIAKELEAHAAEELQHALIVAKQIDYL